MGLSLLRPVLTPFPRLVIFTMLYVQPASNPCRSYRFSVVDVVSLVTPIPICTKEASPNCLRMSLSTICPNSSQAFETESLNVKRGRSDKVYTCVVRAGRLLLRDCTGAESCFCSQVSRESLTVCYTAWENRLR